MAKQTNVDVVSNALTYEWEAELWSATDSPNWSLKQITVSWTVTSTKYPCRPYDWKPTDEPLFKWDSRDIYNYSFVPVKEVVNPTLLSATRDDDTTITVTLSELALAATITKANDGWFTVFETWTPTTTYAVSAINPWATDDLVVLTVADVSASDLVWLTVTYTKWGNGTITDMNWNVLDTDSVWVTIPAWEEVPTMVSAERIADTTIRVTLSEDCSDDTITKANDWWFVVYETWTPETTYAVSAIAKNWDNASQVDLTVADIAASDSVWVTVTYVAWWNWNVADLNANLMITDATWVLVPAWA